MEVAERPADVRPSHVDGVATAAAVDPGDVLESFTAVHGVRGAMLSSADGFSLAHTQSVGDGPGAAAMFAAALAIAHQLAGLDGATAVRQLVLDHDNGLMVIRPVGDRQVLAVLAAADLDQRRLRAVVHAALPQLVGHQR
jgi:predicted regulator of Ras-like GTPase activity (Roadblock/LC7/MglB family)